MNAYDADAHWLTAVEDQTATEEEMFAEIEAWLVDDFVDILPRDGVRHVRHVGDA
jgi:hypothetical protein